LLAVVGLGNPCREYGETRHNVGFRVVDSLAGTDRRFEKKPTYLFVGTRIARRKVILVKPTTFMNRSGVALKALLADFGIEPGQVLLVSDDANLPIGRIRVRPGGSDGGQKGLASVIEAIGTDRIARLRLGIGAPSEGEDLADFVLRPFEEEEEARVRAMIDTAVLCVRTWVTEGVERAMERFNRRESVPRGAEESEAGGGPQARPGRESTSSKREDGSVGDL
jgi:PTH1 family peptidyl-tRNA hydrolase